MSVQYVPVQWNRKKVIYDIILWASISAYIAVFMVTSLTLFQGNEALTPIILLMRALSTCAFVMLTFILCIGPLARIDSRFLPLLYNRRHFGVSMFLVALIHAILAIFWYHGFGVISPFASIFSAPASINGLQDIPFQPFGAIALLLLMLLASTSHDFWNANLGPILWKTLHMMVYLAYLLVVLHVALGAMQEPNTGVLPITVLTSVLLVSSLHIAAATKSSQANVAKNGVQEEWIDVGAWQDIDNNRGMTVTINDGERIAVFRYDDTRIAAVGNACKHQGGPLGEGKVIDGCITCPWHGYQYRPEDGCSPPPYSEKIPTYRVRIVDDRILLHPEPLPDGTAREVAVIGGEP